MRRVRVGMPVRVTFQQQDDVWFPLFEPHPAGSPDAVPPPPLPEVKIRSRTSADKFEDKVAITGIGMSQIGRRLMRPPLSLTVEACKAAVADAGLTMADIDGLSTYPGAMFAGAVGPFNPGPSWQIKGSADFDGDGKSDILWQGSDGTPAIWLMNGSNVTSFAPAGSFNPGTDWHIIA